MTPPCFRKVRKDVIFCCLQRSCRAEPCNMILFRQLLSNPEQNEEFVSPRIRSLPPSCFLPDFLARSFESYWPGLPGSKFLSLLRQRKEPKKDDPAARPWTEASGRAALNSPHLLFDFRSKRGSNILRRIAPPSSFCPRPRRRAKRTVLPANSPHFFRSIAR